MNYTLEQKILARMLKKPDEVLREELKVNWFADETHRQLAYTLIHAEETFSDYSEIELKVKEFYPKSNVTEEWLNAIQYEDVYLSDLRASLKSLEAEYIRDRSHEASLNYAEYPNSKNKENLENWLRKLDELDVEDDEGELSAPINQLLYELDNEVELGLSSFPKLDRQLGAGLEKGMMFVLAGRPGTGKTAYGVSLVVEILQRQPDVQIDFFSLEMAKIEMFKRFIARTTGINGYKFKNTKIALNDDEKRQVIKSADWFGKTGLRIHDNKFSLSAIERTIRQRKHEAEGEYLAVIDYIGLIDAEDNNMQRNQAIGKISRRLKRLTNELEIPIVLMSQLNRGVEHRQDKVPMLADLRESGDLEQDANVVGFLSENKERDHVIDFTIAKNRNGQLGTLYYEFYKPAMTFTETEADSYED